MRHAVFGRKLSRTKNERRRLLAGLARDLILRDGINTTLAKAKAVQPLVEKLITKAKKGNDIAKRHIYAVLTDRPVTERLMDEAKTRFAGRSSGFTRIIKLGKRLGDATDVAKLSFVDERVITDVIAPKKASNKEVAKESTKEIPVVVAPEKKIAKKTKVTKSAKKTK